MITSDILNLSLDLTAKKSKGVIIMRLKFILTAILLAVVLYLKNFVKLDNVFKPDEANSNHSVTMAK